MPTGTIDLRPHSARRRFLALLSVGLCVVAALASALYVIPLVRQTSAVQHLLTGGADVSVEPRLFGLFETAIKVKFPEKGASEADVSPLEDCPNLMCLILSGSATGDKSLESLHLNQPVVWLWLNKTSVTDEGLKYLKDWRAPEMLLYLDDDRITDKGLAYLQGLRLGMISLAGTSVSDDGMANLSRIATLTAVNLSRTNISDYGLAKLAGNGLTHIELRATRITDSGLKTVAGFPGLISLDVSETEVSDLGVACLTPLASLTHLGLASTHLTDQGLTHIAKLTKLESLDLKGTQITDAGLPQLKTLAKLKFIYVENTRLTPAGISELQNIIPNGVEVDVK